MDRCDCPTSFFFPHRAIKCALKILADANIEKQNKEAAVEQSRIDQEARNRRDAADQQNWIDRQNQISRERYMDGLFSTMRATSIPTAQPIPAGD